MSEKLSDYEIRIEQISQDYGLLLTYYKKGYFEKKIMPNLLTTYKIEETPNISDRQTPTELDLNEAINYLYDCAESIYKEGFFKNSIEGKKLKAKITVSFLKIRVLKYELGEYFQTNTLKIHNEFISEAKIMSQNIAAYYNSTYHRETISKDKRKIVKEILLLILCGANSIYRLHDKKQYNEGLKFVTKVKEYLKTAYPEEKLETHSRRFGYGLRAISFYIEGHLWRVNDNLENSEKCFLESSELYSRKIIQHYKYIEARDREINESNEPFLQENGTNRSQKRKEIWDIFDSTKQLTLRRSAIVSSFGIAYLAYSTGRLKEAINLLTLSRAILCNNVGKVYEATVELNYWATKRALNITSSEELKLIIQGLELCREKFDKYIPNAHYTQRTGMQVALCYFYIAFNLNKKKEMPESLEFYKKAERELLKVIEYCKNIEHFNPDKTDDTLVENPTLHSEALVNLTFVKIRMISEKDHDFVHKLNEIMELATKALKIAERLSIHKCEALLAQAAVFKLKAETANNEKTKMDNIELCRISCFSVLENNKLQNPRMEASAYLRLAEVSLLNHKTLLDAYYFIEKWDDLSHKVEHKYCHVWAEEIKNVFLNEPKSFILSYEKIPDKKTAEKQLEESMSLAVLHKVAAKIDNMKIHEIQFKTARSIINDDLMSYLDISSTTADNIIDNNKLIEKLNRICPNAKYLKKYSNKTAGIQRSRNRNTKTQGTPRRKYKTSYNSENS